MEKDGSSKQRIDPREIKIFYENSLRKNELLEQESRYVLQHAISKLNLKIHPIESRIKTLESLINKCTAKNIPAEEIIDIVGLRFTCLFSSDLQTINDLIRENFDCISADEKTNLTTALVICPTIIFVRFHQSLGGLAMTQ